MTRDVIQDVIVAAAAAWGAGTGIALPRLARRFTGATATGRRLPQGAGAAGSAVLSALVCVALALTNGARPELAAWLLLVPPAMLLTRIDLAVRRLPDVLTLPLGTGTAAALGVVALVPGHEGSWTRALLGGVVLGAAYFVLLLINPSGLGFGDVKLAPTLGLALGWYGWPVLFAGTFAGFLLGAITGLILLAAGRANRKTPIPFGPFMLLGALGGVLLGSG
ncbi:A24 family peptidase [Streptomyces sp. RB6PN25]|uniref:A24 family peptidase n=1 Tax=Streptomyces humicola TaxID=2953240 RepID=A0ABT1Q0F6_9ACTN|nr:A24 family peptidase [Streptomyces humicola]MCQ4082265.1 A24 family peptidase [Streptomyces humicola]